MEDAFPVVVVVGLAIFGMFWVGSQADGDFISIGGGDQPDSMLLYSAEPGTIGESNEDFRSVGFGTFTVGEQRGDIQAYTSEREEISRGLISGESIEVNYNATQPEDGRVSFEVLGREGSGKIFVAVNGNRIFEAATISGATPEINISQNDLQPGMNNIKIGTTKSGIFEGARYALEDIEVTVEDRKFHDHTTYFQMYDHELNSFRPSNLTFTVPVDSSTPQEPLEIQINDNQVFSQRIGRSTQGVTITPQNSDLRTGYNTINFGTDGESKYTIENADLQVRYAVNVQPARKNFNFELNDNRLDYIERDNTKEELSFQYQRTTRAEPVEIQVNDAFYRIEPENGINTVELEEEVFEEENSFSISSNQTFRIQNLQMISEMDE
jgi:hypothetical protein